LLLSWAPGGNRELIDIKEAVKLFDIKDVNKTAATFDMDKLDWFNNQYLKNEDPEKLADEVIPALVQKGYIEKDNFDRNYLVSLVKLFQARLTTLNDFPAWADFFFLKDPAMDAQAQEKFLRRDFSKEFSLFIQRLEGLKEFQITDIEKCFRDLVAELNMQAKELIHPVRVALTGKTIGPGLFEVIYYLGRARTKERLSRWITGKQA
jgi:glutamyl/glutaminyl-tRNA synthetase